MQRKKILIISDSSKLHTGFARVTREIFTYLNSTKKYEIAQVGWFHQNTNEDVNYPIWTTNANEKGQIMQDDKYAHKSFPGYVDKFKPDMVWSLGDTWMTDHVAVTPNRNTFKWVMYTPIDGEPIPSKWGKTYDNADVVVAYGKYGMDIMRSRAPKANLKYIYHGVDTDVFKPMDEKQKAYDKQNLLGVSPDKRIIGIVARNQPRKAFDKLFEAYSYVLNGRYEKCLKCNMVTVHPYRVVNKKFERILKCKHCGSGKLEKGKPNDDIRLYVHAAAIDCGWDLIDLQDDYNLKGKILINPGLKIGVGVSNETLAAIYNTFELFTLPTRGEGFGLPILEAMSCGVPVVVTDYSAHTEWVPGCGELIKPITLEAEPMTNIRRAIVDMDLYVTALVKLLEDKDLAFKYGQAARRKAKSMDWKVICKQWEMLIDDILYPGQLPEVVSPDEVEYTLEVI